MDARMHRVGVAVTLALLLAVPAAAQEAGRPDAAADQARDRPRSGHAFLFSVAAPGAGQRALGSERWVPYAALEAWSWLRYVDRRRTGRDFETRYRDLAWSVARRISVGPRRDGAWSYYEAMARYSASGVYDRDPSRPGLQPELDESTFNGALWALARAIHFPAGEDDLAEDTPEYRRALEYYRQRAITPEFAWEWGGHGLEQQAYRELIRKSDEALRSATMLLGLVLANHLVSGVDALISARLEAAGRRAPPVELESGFEPGADLPRWYVGARIRWPPR